MRWLRFFVIIQAVLIFFFIVVYMFQWASDEYKDVDVYQNSTSSGGYLPTKNNFEFSKFSKGATILLVVSVLELIIITKTFK